MAAGVPVVQPRHAAFPEIVEATGGGMLFEPGDIAALVRMPGNRCSPIRRAPRELGRRGRDAVQRDYSMPRLAERFVEITPRNDGRRFRNSVTLPFSVPMPYEFKPDPPRGICRDGHGGHRALLEFLPHDGGDGARVLPLARLHHPRPRPVVDDRLAAGECDLRLHAPAALRGGGGDSSARRGSAHPLDPLPVHFPQSRRRQRGRARADHCRLRHGGEEHGQAAGHGDSRGHPRADHGRAAGVIEPRLHPVPRFFTYRPMPTNHARSPE